MSAIRKISILYFPIFFLLLMIREEFFVALFTEQYLDSVPFFTVNLFAMLLLIPLNDPVFRAFPKYQYYRLKVSFMGLLMLPLILYLFWKILGAIGVVCGNIFVNLITQTVLFLKCLKILQFSLSEFYSLLRTFGKGFLVSATACLPVLVFKYLTQFQSPLYVLFAGTMIYATAYVLLIYYFNLITKDEKQEIKDNLLKYWNQYGFGKLAK